MSSAFNHSFLGKWRSTVLGTMQMVPFKSGKRSLLEMYLCFMMENVSRSKGAESGLTVHNRN